MRATLLDFSKRHRVALSALLLAILPLVLPYEALAVNILIFGLFAVGFNLLFGYTGLLSFGHAAFFGSGSYACGILMQHYGVPFWLAIPLGTLFAASTGLVIGALAIRTRGIYFSMVTLALGQCLYTVAYQAEPLTGGENGLRGISIAPISVGAFTFDIVNPTTKFYFIWAIVVMALWFVSRVLASPFGSVLEAVRENERRAAACGYNTYLTKLLAFVLSAAICGLAGTLRAIHLSIVPIDSLHYLTSGQVVMMSLLGGIGSFFGPMIGAGLFLGLEEGLTAYTRYWQGALGLVFIACVLFFPQGVWGRAIRLLQRGSR
jgi:branched-chain amino acid transport system permease protein